MTQTTKQTTTAEATERNPLAHRRQVSALALMENRPLACGLAAGPVFHRLTGRGQASSNARGITRVRSHAQARLLQQEQDDD